MELPRAPDERPPVSGPSRVFRRLGPIVVSAAILYFYLRGLDWERLADIGQRVNLPLAIAAVALPQLLAWFFGSLMIVRTLVWFHGPFGFWRFFWLRGASYVLAFVNSALHGGGLLLYQQRRSGISWTKLLGVVLFRVGLTMWGIGLLMIPATLAIHYYGLAERIHVNLYVWWAILIFGVIWLVEAWINSHHDKRFGLSKLVSRNRDSEFWTAFQSASPRQWYLTWLMSAPSFIGTVVGYHLLNRAFGIDAPLVESLVVLPLALLVMDLPIAFAGFGTATIAWMTFFGDYGSVESITALTLFLPGARMLCRAVIAAVSLKPALSEIEFLIASLRSGREGDGALQAAQVDLRDETS